MAANLVRRLQETPAAVKGLIALVTGIISFVLLVRSHFALAAVIFGALLLAGLFAACARVAFAMTARGVGLGASPPRVKYPRARPWAFAGMAAVLVAGALVYAYQPTRRYVSAALAGKHVPPRADVLIAQFDARHASNTYEIPNRLKTNLAQELRNHRLDHVTVETFADAITSPAEAQDSAEQAGSKVVVWGWYDDAGVTINLYAPEPPQTGEETLGLREVAWSKGGADSDLSFKLREQLPENTSFISLFVIGQLYYQNNEYQRGHQAFDAAMASMPKDADVANESVIRFFSARSLEAAGSKDTAKIICEYAKAVELNPKFAAAYNNLGILTSKLLAAFKAVPASNAEDAPGFEFPEESRPCLAKIGLDGSQDIRAYFFEKALEAQPDSAVIRYNKLASWWQQEEPAGFTQDEEIRGELEKLIQKDPSIPGAHVMLGVLSFKEKDAEFDDGNYQTAVREFAAASALLPKSAELHVNTGKAHQRKGRLAEAKAEYEKALALAPGNVEARLALADLALRQGQAGEALKQLNAVSSNKYEDRYALRMVAVLKARAQFQSSGTAAAVETLRGNAAQLPEPTPPPGAGAEEEEAAADPFVTDNDTSLSHYVIGLMHALNSDAAAAAAAWKKCDVPLPSVFDGDPTPSFNDDRNKQVYADNDTASVVWYDLLWLCRRPGEEGQDVSRWGEANPCLPRDLRERIARVFELAQERVAHRIYYRRAVMFGGLACPYVFTRGAGGWQFDTTILYRLDSAAREATQLRPLARFDGSLLVREVEPEISHVDLVSVVVEDGLGRTHVLRPQLKAAREADGEYLILRRGDEVRLSFPDFANVKEPQRARVVARGYYIPEGGAGGARSAVNARGTRPAGQR